MRSDTGDSDGPPVDDASVRGVAESFVASTESHRGGFGEYGGETSAFIERSFRERIVVVGVAVSGESDEVLAASLDEMERLVGTAGADVVGRVVQRRAAPDPATFIGSGKAQEVRELADATDCDTVVVDAELSPAQQGNLERLLGRSAIDRTAVILDIFAQNAASLEGKAQVELALLKYRLPRLRGRGTSLSQQGAGIGTRGPGETQLEVDRRRLVQRIHRLEQSLRSIDAHRETQRRSRERAGVPQIAIVGYTNAGKSTLLNALTDAGVLAADRLFATLDATTRRLDLPGGERVVLVDTVGFVNKLPHQLVTAFRSTLRVAADADLLVHVVDGASDDPLGQIAAVDTVLAEIGAGDRPQLVAVNKSDLVDTAWLTARLPGSVQVSAARGSGLDALLAAVSRRLHEASATVHLYVPYVDAAVLAAVHRNGDVVSETADDDGVAVVARLDERALGALRPYLVSGAGMEAGR